MSTWEYDDMYEAAQKNGGRYYMRVVDIVGSTYINPYEYVAYVNTSKRIERENAALGIKRYQLGDAIGFLAETKDRDLVDALIVELVAAHKNLAFHDASGYCDTLNWVEGDKLYHAGYLFDKLSNLHKETKRH